MSVDKKDFNELVDLVMVDPALSAMRPVVEKELLHYEIFQALDAEGLLKDLVFQGGTSLRLCCGSDRFSEDLDFRHRDIWDLAWMSTRGAKLNPQLVAAKIGDYGVADYSSLLERAIERIPQIVKSREFRAQMTRFIDSATVAKTLSNDAYSDYLAVAVGGLFKQMKTALAAMPQGVRQIPPEAASA